MGTQEISLFKNNVIMSDAKWYEIMRESVLMK